ncbi:pif-2 [Oryctes rhinoceros nudivirus]|uniref:Per-os infectivity factor 2 n=1 Tax=Oryctes rhinoceros nudivirus TaxID=92521 RepID=A3QTZ9_9VIRU|nr:pif-2 [Oryctes rhinoceros nudivirus]ABF93335.1 per-os infectivity factor 2 [Oryctes rhinoceros nudivirus]ACH96147.1 pif-2 [Oryctes rhinoceros nudivirus]QHG11256.1 pif-2 protein [Oryctes rhinoceros nudivirus]QKE59491.1 pif-2 [Oryctes rhinoceros nudivirus]UBO76438.1 PIF-2 [Oryctes rhinoceros nudivirus]
MNINLIGLLFTVILCILVLYAMYILLYYSFDKNIKTRNEELASKLADDKLQALLNGSGINNIPNLNIITTNASVSKANACGKGPVNIGNSGTTQDCIRTCANSSASVINVADGETYIYESAILQPGANCILGPRPQCNMKTSYAMMTINSVICRSRFPDIVGGTLGTNVVACNNKHITDPQNYLWDYKYNKKFDPLTTDIINSDEILPDGTYRFRCQFKGYDIRQNQYIQHPNDRFQPFRNYCASEIYAAHPNIKTVFNADGTYECDCGDFQETRTQNIIPGDKTSICSNVVQSETVDVNQRSILNVPYKCFTMFSSIEDVGKYLPCPNEQFTREGSQFGVVSVPFSTNPYAVIEHPMYKDMSSNASVKVFDFR